MIDTVLSPTTTTGGTHPATSRQAAEAMRLRVGTARFRVLVLLSLGDFTDDEIVAALGMSPNTARPRRVELMRAGLVEATEVRRRTVSGCWSIVWTITEAGLRELRTLGQSTPLGAVL